MIDRRTAHIYIQADPPRAGDTSVCGAVMEDDLGWVTVGEQWFNRPQDIPCLECCVMSGFEGPAGVFPLTAEDRASRPDHILLVP